MKISDILIESDKLLDDAAERKYNELNAAFEKGGEEALAQAMGISVQQLDHAIAEAGYDYGMHADDDRDEIIARVMDDFSVSYADRSATSDNGDLK